MALGGEFSQRKNDSRERPRVASLLIRWHPGKTGTLMESECASGDGAGGLAAAREPGDAGAGCDAMCGSRGNRRTDRKGKQSRVTHLRPDSMRVATLDVERMGMREW
jgi:hypothetical protein